MKHSEPVCPCGMKGASYLSCCGRYIEHAESAAPTAEVLMRSRYTAYTLQAVDYLLATWHADHRPDKLELSGQDPTIKWLGLALVRTVAGQPGDLDGLVEFVARYKVGGRAYLMHEVSRFVCIDGRWYYLDGEVS